MTELQRSTCELHAEPGRVIQRTRMRLTKRLRLKTKSET